MFYKKPFYIESPVGNNALSFEKRLNKKLFVPNLIDGTFENIELWNEVVFEDYDFENQLISAKWLKHFYKLKWKDKDLYLFDNHNHAFYFWYLAKKQWIIGENCTLYHVDEHSDMRKPETYMTPEDAKNMQKVFDYTNFTLNVGNYILPAIEEWLIKNVVQIRNQQNLFDYNFKKTEENDIILNLDLDFFEPALDYIDYESKKNVVLDIASKAKIITVATSPFFINQTLALKVFKDLFNCEKNFD